jgi:hypothetical protein
VNEDRAKWEWPTDEIKRVGYQVVDLIAEHLTSLPERPVFQPYPRTLAEKLLETAPPATGASADESVAEFRSDIEPYPFGNGHPRFFGWVNSPPAVIGIFAEARAATTRPSTLSGTPLEQKLNQLSLSSMSRQLETTLTEAAAKNLSAAATGWPTWKSKPVHNVPWSAVSDARACRLNPVSTLFTSITTRAVCRPNPVSCACSISRSSPKGPTSPLS